jgi:hypothetical protein
MVLFVISKTMKYIVLCKTTSFMNKGYSKSDTSNCSWEEQTN